MKKLFIYAITAVALLTTGCNMLEEDVYGQISEEEMLANKNNVVKIEV